MSKTGFDSPESFDLDRFSLTSFAAFSETNFDFEKKEEKNNKNEEEIKEEKKRKKYTIFLEIIKNNQKHTNPNLVQVREGDGDSIADPQLGHVFKKAH